MLFSEIQRPDFITDMSKTISTDSLMHESRTFPPSPEVKKRALLNAEQFDALYQQSLREPDKFWLEQANALEWFKTPTVAGKFTWDTAARKIEHTWFEDGQLNLTVNCLDRHVKTKLRDKVAIIWQGDAEDEVKKITYGELHRGRLQVRQRAEIARHQKRRPRGDLHADDSRGRRRHARLRAHRRDSFGGVRRVQRGFALRPHQRFRLQTARHGECIPARRQRRFRSRKSPTPR